MLDDRLFLRRRALNDIDSSPDGQYVLCWLRHALRAFDNPILDTAVALGNHLDRPVVVLHWIWREQPYASHRLLRFELEASRSLEADLTERGLRFVRVVDQPGTPLPVGKLLSAACALVTDDHPTSASQTFAYRAAKQSGKAVWLVDGACLVPMQAFPQEIQVTKAFRAAHTPQRVEHLATPADLQPKTAQYDGSLTVDHTPLPADALRLDALIADCGVDMSLPPVPDFTGTRAAALDQLTWAIEAVVPRYRWTRNNPADPSSTTRLSPWMHYGLLGPREVAQAVHHAELHSSARWKFLDELLTWREFYFHLAHHASDPAAYINVPAWGRATLAAHTSDPRPEHYDLDALVHGESYDETWNAAQKQYLYDGWMHNNLRMYWVKKLIEWHATPEEAWATACYLNDRFSLDGRHPATYGSIQWGFGRSKKGYREIPIYGWVPPKSDRALRRREGVPDWLAEQAARAPYRVSVHSNLTVAG